MFLNDANNCRLVIAVLIKRLGGAVTVTEEDLHAVSFKFLDEHEQGSKGQLHLAVSDSETFPDEIH